MKLPVSLVIASHLSDIQETSLDTRNNLMINFIKHLINEHPYTDVEIDADEEWERYKELYPNLFRKKD